MKLKKKNQSKEIKLEDEIFLKKKTRKMKSNLAGQSWNLSIQFFI